MEKNIFKKELYSSRKEMGRERYDLLDKIDSIKDYDTVNNTYEKNKKKEKKPLEDNVFPESIKKKYEDGRELERYEEEKSKQRFLQTAVENRIIPDSKIKERLDGFSKSYMDKIVLSTILSKEIYETLCMKEVHEKVLTGRIYSGKEVPWNCDVLFNLEGLSNLERLISERIPSVPVFSRKKLKNPQKTFLYLNKKFPELKKTMLTFTNHSPLLFRLVEKDECQAGMFFPSNYISLD